VRDATAMAAPGVPLTAIVTRPDGKEQTRIPLADQGLGGTVTPVNLPANAMRGAWRIAVHADVKRRAARAGHVPRRGFRARTPGFRSRDDRSGTRSVRSRGLEIDARFLYGAPASNLSSKAKRC
jgi:uncharacterized protein YfaS (alpha-2-macroglobulin family)